MLLACQAVYAPTPLLEQSSANWTVQRCPVNGLRVPVLSFQYDLSPLLHKRPGLCEHHFSGSSIDAEGGVCQGDICCVYLQATTYPLSIGHD